MTVYVVYEGDKGNPIKAFSSEEKAKAFAYEANHRTGWDLIAPVRKQSKALRRAARYSSSTRSVHHSPAEQRLSAMLKAWFPRATERWSWKKLTRERGDRAGFWSTLPTP